MDDEFSKEVDETEEDELEGAGMHIEGGDDDMPADEEEVEENDTM